MTRGDVFEVLVEGLSGIFFVRKIDKGTTARAVVQYHPHGDHGPARFALIEYSGDHVPGAGMAHPGKIIEGSVTLEIKDGELLFDGKTIDLCFHISRARF